MHIGDNDIDRLIPHDFLRRFGADRAHDFNVLAVLLHGFAVRIEYYGLVVDKENAFHAFLNFLLILVYALQTFGIGSRRESFIDA
jgi:hypothetical protein